MAITDRVAEAADLVEVKDQVEAVVRAAAAEIDLVVVGIANARFVEIIVL